ncbi:hypothetical protein POM88_017834 [Heracleum sosnowskyi]|uniref:Uncharacterized protein n=1 Tax=Heracleum sosnowskyi TaxID=360622 RepID=A0AAD8MYI8_9APIA|nr:hypothetical protein POM88_017834 [Heracleum sosnowskyi]
MKCQIDTQRLHGSNMLKWTIAVFTIYTSLESILLWDLGRRDGLALWIANVNALQVSWPRMSQRTLSTALVDHLGLCSVLPLHFGYMFLPRLFLTSFVMRIPEISGTFFPMAALFKKWRTLQMAVKLATAFHYFEYM